MDSEEKKPRRPRIGQSRQQMPATDGETNHERVNYGQNAPYHDHAQDYNPNQGYNPNYHHQRYNPNYNQQRRPYNPNQQGEYNPNYNPGYNHPYRPYVPQQDFGPGYMAEEGQVPYRPGNPYHQQGGYRPRPNAYGQQRPNHYNPMKKKGKKAKKAQQPRPGKKFFPRPKPVEYEIEIPDPDSKIRLNKFMANSGVCSRREADDFIQQGLVKVNGEVVTELGTKIGPNDVVEYDDKVVALERKTYILLNKPKDCVTTVDDPNERRTVMDLIKGACTERVYPVGRLDRNTTGVLLLTNDGDLASKLTHPKYVKKKIYHVWVDRDIPEDDMQAIADGIELEAGPVQVDEISYATDKAFNQAGIEIHSGRNRIVRRIFEHLGYHVTKLDRVFFAGLTKKDLPRGRWRYLTQQEVNMLKRGAFE
ncbi:MAG: RNA-binding S4 domain-containing protein [Muribaculaceae bacterium]|nr:RNA-binding S4 domain-containing protein [Muribaculaceae bacterium]